MTKWHNCYDESWNGSISPEAFAHPAKFSRALIRRIYSHLIERDWLKPGDTVADPFGGVGLGAADALASGINWIGCELESRFVAMGAGCECAGISKADWVRFYGRWGKLKNVCPRCIAQAGQVTDSGPQLSLFDSEPSAAYVRNSGQIPYTEPHYYAGNLDRFRRYARGGAWAKLVQGDSRQLSGVIGQVCGVISSPPYISSHVADITTGRIGDSALPVWKQTAGDNYGSSSGQLGQMKEGNLSAVITSPPFAGNSGGRGEASRNGIDAALFDRHSGGMIGGTGDDPANLAHLPVRGIEAVISSPPYASGCAHTGGDDPQPSKIQGGKRGVYGVENGYGEGNGQLGAMPEGQPVSAVITSPPYEASNQDYARGLKYIGRSKSVRKGGDHYESATYGDAPGQLGNNDQETFWQAARQIVTECHKILKPGGVSVWVVKDFVRDGARVPFCDQWRQLCEAVGFEFVERHQAMLVKSNGTQINLDGEAVQKETQRKSFFRRLAEAKGSPRIDWEEVLILRKRV